MTLEFATELGGIRSLTVKERQPIERIKPLVAGDTAPFFSLVNTTDDWQASVFTAGLPGHTTSLLDLINNQPLVLSFYCPCWGRYARPYLDALVQLSAELKTVGARLLVFSNEAPKSLAKQVSLVDLRVVHDADFTVARRFGVYSEDDPIWDRISGISEDVYIPALYVIGADRRISYHFLDEDFDGPFDQQAVVNEVTALSVLT